MNRSTRHRIAFLFMVLILSAASTVVGDLPDWDELRRIPDPERVPWRLLEECEDIREYNLANSLVCEASFNSKRDGTYKMMSVYGKGPIEFRSGERLREFEGKIIGGAPDNRFYSVLGIGTTIDLYGSGPIEICGWTMDWGRMEIDSTGFIYQDRTPMLPIYEWTFVKVPPRIKKEPLIEFPKEAQEQGFEGKVGARLWIGADGLVIKVDVIRAPSPLLENLCRETLEACEFIPAQKKDGVPSKSVCHVVLDFQRTSKYAKYYGPELISD